MATTFQDMQVTINISDVDAEEIYPERVVVLQHPDWFINVGRGNSTDESLMPQQHNTWFASRVMSRHHATLRADPKEKRLFITDAGSMHGTFINGQKITMDQPYELLHEDIITFGSQVVRGDDIFPPLKVAIHFAWSENDKLPQPKAYPNSFTADYSEEDVPSDISDDDEIEIIRELVKQPSVEILEHGFIEQTHSIITSPSINSEPSLPSESDPTSVSVLEVEEIQAKALDVPHEDVQQDYRSRESSVDSDRYSPSLDEDDEIITTAVEHVNLPLQPCVTSEPSNAIATTRDPSPSDAAMAKAAPVEPKFDIRPPDAASKLGNLTMHDGSQPWQSSLFDFNNTSFSGPFGYNISHQYLHPPALGPYNVPLPSPPPPPAHPTGPSLRDPCIEASWLSDISEPRIVRPPTVLPRLGSHMIASCGRKRKVYEISGQLEPVASDPEMVSGKIANKAQELSKSIETAQEPLIAPTDTVDAATTPLSQPQCEVPLNPTAKDSPAVVEPQSTAAPVEEAAVDEPQRKKIKKTKDAKTKAAIKPSSTSSQIMKYAATAFAGATVGAIGTVFGLAALPTDFFA